MKTNVCKYPGRIMVKEILEHMTEKIIRPISYAGCDMDSNLVLAPIAGTTAWPFRLLCQEQGAGWTVTELVSAKGIRYDSELRRQYRYLAINPRERRVAIQLFSSEPQDVDYAIRHILELPDFNLVSFIDLNLGCPVKKVVKTGAGSALLDTPDLAIDLCRAAVLATQDYGKKVTVKIRSGCNEKMRDLSAFVKRIEDSGVAGIVVHPRLAVQMYGGKADWDVIREVKEAVRIPVIGNGDLISPQSVRRMADATGADGFMIGRAARGNPWIFSDIIEYFADAETADKSCRNIAGEERRIIDGKAKRIINGKAKGIIDGKVSITECKSDSDAERESMSTAGRDTALRTMIKDPVSMKKISLWQMTVMKHLGGMIELLGEEQAVREMRKQLAFYTKGLPGVSALRPRLMNVLTVSEVESELANLVKDM